VTPAPRDAPAARGRGRFAFLMALCAIAFAGFIALGNWQVRREGWKLKLIHDVTARVHASPVAAPGPAAWPRIVQGHLQYLHVQLHGRFLAGKSTRVHGTSDLGYGYWVMTPFESDRGFIVLVNRGYVPAGTPGAQTPAPEGETSLTGLLRFSEPGGGFFRPNRPKAGEWYSRDVAAIAAARALPASRVAPYFVDADATGTRARGPVAGLTKIHFRNAHVGYAITWYLMALGTLLGAGLIIRERRRAVRVRN
jgi:surfeit locus 1 family protein